MGLGKGESSEWHTGCAGEGMEEHRLDPVDAVVLDLVVYGGEMKGKGREMRSLQRQCHVSESSTPAAASIRKRRIRVCGIVEQFIQ
jgi:hypothetical protein